MCNSLDEKAERRIARVLVEGNRLPAILGNLYQEFADVVIDLVSYTAEHGETLFRRALGGGRILQAPAKEPEGKRKDWATLLRLIAHANGVSKALPKCARHVLDFLVGDVYSNFVHCVDRERAERGRFHRGADWDHGFASQVT